MRQIVIDYWMSRPRGGDSRAMETEKGSVTLPMEPETADKLLTMQSRSELLLPFGEDGILYGILQDLAVLQGYRIASFIAAEERADMIPATPMLKEMLPAADKPAPTESETDQPAETPADKPFTRREPEKEYRGFVFLRCPKCGKERAFCAKQPMTRYLCRDCGALSELPPPTRVYVRCECGNQAKYVTNIGDWCFDVPCIQCGAPCPVEYHPGKRIYVPAGSLGARKSHGRKKDAK